MASTEAQVRIQGHMTEGFVINRGLKQGDGLAPTLFNLALEYVIRKLSVGRNNVLTNKSVQLAAYADDINIMCRTKNAAEETCFEHKENANNMCCLLYTSRCV